MNENIYVKKPWSIERLFSEYLKNFKQPVQLTRQIKGPIGQVKLIETLNEHYKDYTFKPKIWSMSKEIEEKKRMEARQKFSQLQESISGMNPEDSSNCKQTYWLDIDHISSTFDLNKQSRL